jgi:hypothetical protein
VPAVLSNVNLLSNTIWASLESIGIVTAGFIALSRFFRKFDHRLETLDKRLDRIEYQFKPNSGESMKDQLDRQDSALQELKTDVAVIKATSKIKTRATA